MAGSGEHLSCSFCGTGQQQAGKLIGAAGVAPRTFICDGCVRRAHEVMARPGHTVATPIATIQQVSAAAAAAECSFCGKRRHQVAAMASAGDTLAICDECLDLCDQIISEDPPPRVTVAPSDVADTKEA